VDLLKKRINVIPYRLENSRNERNNISRSRAQESSAAIEKMYITMLTFLMRILQPMKYQVIRFMVLRCDQKFTGNIEEKVELNGLLYVIERLVGIEECRFINLTRRRLL
jgi:hypothetical protein